MTGEDDAKENDPDHGVESTETEKEQQLAPAAPYRIGSFRNRGGGEVTANTNTQTTPDWRAGARPLPERPSRNQGALPSRKLSETPTPSRQTLGPVDESIWSRKPSFGSIKSYKPYGERHRNDFYVPGVVISAYHHMSPNITESMQEAEDTFLSPRGQWILSKRRKFIVVERHVNHCITIPIYTYGKKGLLEKSNLTNEYIGVFDSAETDDHKSQSIENGYVLGTRAPAFGMVPKGDFHFFDSLSHAHLTNPVCFDYASPSKYEGNIKPENIKKLLTKYYNCMPKDGGSPKQKRGNKGKEVASFEEEAKD
ncbi:hypothetical protein DL98DRAFT_593428 [Cadophora sp. DSE1049]|nr:hypothetical protein DL98DRAFT_593428 [Cadophora sp. DSE1049]